MAERNRTLPIQIRLVPRMGTIHQHRAGGHHGSQQVLGLEPTFLGPRPEVAVTSEGEHGQSDQVAGPDALECEPKGPGDEAALAPEDQGQGRDHQGKQPLDLGGGERDEQVNGRQEGQLRRPHDGPRQDPSAVARKRAAFRARMAGACVSRKASSWTAPRPDSGPPASAPARGSGRRWSRHLASGARRPFEASLRRVWSFPGKPPYGWPEYVDCLTQGWTHVAD
ncbi:hypothetical protein DL765_007383 [Monosporascus sp. GIB2]|nr:hypothetical protein DL765_007383 [Monosporascus sp. GIB2]